jgi:hypothetical protein
MSPKNITESMTVKWQRGAEKLFIGWLPVLPGC